jgi:hypothetical protein
MVIVLPFTAVTVPLASALWIPTGITNTFVAAMVVSVFVPCTETKSPTARSAKVITVFGIRVITAPAVLTV